MASAQKANKRRFGSLPMALFYGVICYQFFIWQSHAPRASWLQIKSAMGRASLSEQIELGAICNSLKRFSCSKKVFSKILEISANSTLALANLGIAQAHEGECSKAIDTLDTYLALANASPSQDVLTWYARCQRDNLKKESALSAYYWALAISPENSNLAEELVDYLLEMGREEEALSALASLTSGRPGGLEKWRKLLARALERANSRDSINRGGKKRAFRLPSFDGRDYFVPVRFSIEQTFDFVKVSRENSQFNIQNTWVNRLRLETGGAVRDLASQSSEAFTIGQLQLGPWVLHDLEARVCDNCETAIGETILTQLSSYEQFEPGMKFLVLQSR